MLFRIRSEKAPLSQSFYIFNPCISTVRIHRDISQIFYYNKKPAGREPPQIVQTAQKEPLGRNIQF